MREIEELKRKAAEKDKEIDNLESIIKNIPRDVFSTNSREKPMNNRLSY